MGRVRNNKLHNKLRNNTTINELYKKLDTYDPNVLIDAIFDWLYFEVDNYKKYKNSLYINEGLKLIAILSKDRNANKKDITERLKKLYKKISVRCEYKNYFTEDLEIAKNNVENLYYIVETYNSDIENNEYKLFEYIIFNNRNVDRLKEILTLFPEILSVKDKDGKSIIYKIISRLFGLIITEGEVEEILYLTDVVNTISSDEKLYFDKEEQIEILKQSRDVVINLYANRSFNKEKTNLINNVIDNISNICYKTEEEKELTLSYEEENEEFKELIYKQLINDYIISIDDQNTKMIDDALSARKLSNGNYLLGIHIASVLGYYDYNSFEVQRALEKKNTGCLFSKQFCTNDASLVQGETRRAESHYFELTPNGKIAHECIIKNIIINNCKTNHERVEQILNKGCENKKLESTVNNLAEITKIINKRYDRKIDMDKEYNKYLSNHIVENMMILHNESIANYFYEKRYPTIYRVQCNSFETPRYDLFGSHEGLKLKHYTQCSSPLRRSVDIIVQRGLDIYYHKICSKEDRFAYEAEIEMRVKKLNELEEKSPNKRKSKQKVKRRLKNIYT